MFLSYSHRRSFDAIGTYRKRMRQSLVDKNMSDLRIDLAHEEESEAMERAVRLRVLKKIVNRRAETKSMPEEKRKLRMEFERQKQQNREAVIRWRNKFGRHRTVHHLDRAERIRSENRTIEDKLDGMVKEVMVMKARFNDLLQKNEHQMKISNGRRRILPEAKVTEINNWLAQVPGMLKKVADTQITGIREEKQKPESSEYVCRDPRKTIRLSTISLPSPSN